jgi:hypothetical protein
MDGKHDECEVGQDVNDAHAKPELWLWIVSRAQNCSKYLTTHQVVATMLGSNEAQRVFGAALEGCNELADYTPQRDRGRESGS